jgi:hypothetical protein
MLVMMSCGARQAHRGSTVQITFFLRDCTGRLKLLIATTPFPRDIRGVTHGFRPAIVLAGIATVVISAARKRGSSSHSRSATTIQAEELFIYRSVPFVRSALVHRQHLPK